MALRSISTGSLSFGLVNVPVKLYATGRGRASEVRFHWLHAECNTRVKQQYYCPKHERAVGRDELVRGYEVSKNKYVPVTEEEIEETKVASRDSIDILSFVPTATVDVLYLEHSYYLGPDKGGGKGYSVLVQAMKRAERVAIARYAARGSEHIVSVRADGDVLVMHQLRYADEVRQPDEVPVEHPKVSDAELRLATQLIEQTAEDEFDPESFEDEAKARKKALIARKTAAGEVAVEETAARGKAGGKVIDLMEALKASLGGARADGHARKPARGAAGRTRRTRSTRSRRGKTAHA
jgi:DNA end-binding protein Ku